MTAAEAREFLDAAYAAVFRRAADQGGLETYTTAMQAGMSATDILREFLASAEFRDAAFTNVSTTTMLGWIHSWRRFDRWPMKRSPKSCPRDAISI